MSEQDLEAALAGASGNSNPYDFIPSYLVAADNHQVANGDMSLGEIVKTGLGVAAGAAAGQALIPIPVVGAVVGGVLGGLTAESDGKFVQASIISGANSFYNSGVAVANFFGADAEEVNTLEYMQERDSDLAAYYEDNRNTIDLAGFIGGSMIPGLAAVKAYNYTTKALNMAKYGLIGANTEAATGLLAPFQQKALAAAVSEITSSNATFSLLNRNSLTAVLAGFGEQAIQSAVFETAVAATMFKSPILEDMDAGDLGANILFGTIVGGGIGGILEGAVSYGAVKKAKAFADIEQMPFMHRTEMRAGAKSDERIILYADDKFNTPEVPEELRVKYAARPDKLRSDKLTNIDLDIRTELQGISSDAVVGNMFADMLSTAKSTQEVGDVVLGLRSVGRLADKSEAEGIIKSLQRKIAGGDATAADEQALKNWDVVYSKVWGEGAGNTFADAPQIIGIQDTLRSGEEIRITQQGVKVGKGNFIKFNSKAGSWDIMTATQHETEARYLWAYHSAPLDEKAVLGATDFPLLEKAYMESAGNSKRVFTIQQADGKTQLLRGRDELLTHIEESKIVTKHRMQTATADQQIISDPILAERKLKELTGVHFQVGKGDNAVAWTYLGDSNTRRDIFVDAHHLVNQPISRLVQALKHEEGHNAWNLITDIGMVPKADLTGVLSEAEKASRQIRHEHWKQADATKRYDYVRDPHELMADMFAYASLHTQEEVFKVAPTFAKHLYAHVNPVPQEVVDSLRLKAKQLSNEEIAKRLNMRLGYIEGTKVHTGNKERDLFANQSYAADYADKVRASGVKVDENPLGVLLKPQHLKLGMDKTAATDLDGNMLEAIAAIKQKQVIYQQASERVFAGIAGDMYDQFFRMPEEITFKAMSAGAGQSAFGFANGTYGSAASHFERIGVATHNLMVRKVNATHDALQPVLHKIANDLPSATELSILLNKVRSTPEKYVLSEDGTELWRRGYKVEQDAIKQGVSDKELAKIRAKTAKVDSKAEDIIPIKSTAVQEYVGTHISLNGARVNKFTEIRNQQGMQDLKDGNTFYAPPVNPKDYPHFAFVVDNTITGTGHVKMIHAASEQELDALISKVPAGLTTITKGSSERFHEAYGDYLADAALHENYIDSALHKSGVSAQYFPTTDPAKLVNDLLQWHTEKERQLVREGVNLMYSKEFAEFRKLGEQYTELATSKYGRLSNLKIAEETVHNPYIDYIKTALDIQKSSDARLWTSLNTSLDQKVSNIWNKITGTLVKTKSPEELDFVNEAMKDAGIKTAYYDAALDILANHTAPKGVLTSFVQKANALLAGLTLRMDVLNAVNNTVGSLVLTAPEMLDVIKAIKTGNAEAVGELAQLAHVKIPGSDRELLSPTKLMHNAIRNWHDPLRRETAFRDGFTSRHSMEHQGIMEEFTLGTTESVADLNNKIRTAYDKTMSFINTAEKYTGNKLAEEFTRFAAADIMRQITDVAVKHGIIDRGLAKSYIGTFVNRTQGNYLASQRPLAFQGPIGQAVGLFQTYQFNMMQQLFRRVADSEGKSAAMMLGLQGTIYGMNGLPAFQALNSSLIGNAAGNTNHRDIYSATYEAVNKTSADWLMYGAASNMLGLFHPDLKLNLYTRGDINPRHASILPTNFSELPIINASAKFFGNLLETGDKLLAGGNVGTTLLQGLEHNGVNRPLAGLAQSLEAFTNPELRSFSTTSGGSISASNDLFTLANFSRILGAKPMDEAIAIDFGFRKTVYQAVDANRRKQLGEVIKSTVIGGGVPSEDQLHSFMEAYVKTGGRQQNFNRYMMDVYKSANTSQTNVIANALKTPYAQTMQTLLGGASMRDFTTDPINQNLGE